MIVTEQQHIKYINIQENIKMSKASKTVENNEVDVDQEFEAFMSSFEEEGVVTSIPTLAEGWYPALLTELSCNFGITAKKGKNTPLQADGKYPWFMLQAQFKTNSLTARETVKRDNDPTIRADGDCYGFPGNLQLHDRMGIARDGNGQFWNFIGKLFSQIGMAEEFKDGEGNTGYKLDPSIIKAIYGHTPALYKDLHEKVLNGEPVSSNEKQNEPKLIPAIIAASQLAKLTEYLASPDGDTTLQKVVLLVAVRERYNDPSKKDNFAKDFRFWSDVSETVQEDTQGTTFTILNKGTEIVTDLLV